MFRIETMNLNFYMFYCHLILFNFGGLKYNINNKISLLEKKGFKMKTIWIKVSSFFNCHSAICWGFPTGSAVKNCAVQETRVWFLGWQDPLEKETVTSSSIFAWEIPRTEEPDGLQSMGLQKSQMWLSTVHGLTKESDVT